MTGLQFKLSKEDGNTKGIIIKAKGEDKVE